MILFLIICLALNFLCGFACLIFNFNFIYVVFMCLDAGVLAFMIPAYVTSKKDEKILEFWNKVGKLPPELQKAILSEGNEVVCSICGRVIPKVDISSFRLATGVDALVKGSKLRCTCKHCIKKTR